MKRSLVLSLPFVVLGLFLITGCGGDDLPPNYKTTIEISYKGAPVEGAIVTLRPDGHDAPSANGVTGADGKVDMYSWKGKGKGVVPGKYKVAVEKQQIAAPTESLSTDDPNYGKEVDEVETRQERKDELPAKYVTASGSPLACEVTDDPSKNVFTFELED